MTGTIRALMEGSPQAQVSTPVQTTIGTTAATFLMPNQKRKGVWFQNTGTTVIKLTFGDTLPTQTVYHVALAACSSADDGKGGTYFEDAWVGKINVISSGAGGTFVYGETQTGASDFNQAADYVAT